MDTESKTSEQAATFAVGDRVRATYPNTSWGNGVVIDVDLNRRGVNPATGRKGKQKPLIVRHDDGHLGHFHLDQVEKIIPLTAESIDAALADDRHLGWGYATREHLSDSTRRRLDRAVLRVANELGLTAEDLFRWTNSKYGRWLVDAATSRVNADVVRQHLNPEAVASSKKGI